MTTTTDIELAVAVVVVVSFVVANARRRTNVYGKLWAPLIPLINGSAQGSRLSGTYQGMPLTARIAGEGDENPSFHYELTFTPGITPKDWALSFTGEKFLGTGTKTWRVKSKDDDLKRRLTEAGAVTAIQNWASQPEISYKSKGGTLHYWQPVESMYAVPTPEEFKAQLDLLSRLAEINRRVNTD